MANTINLESLNSNTLGKISYFVAKNASCHQRDDLIKQLMSFCKKDLECMKEGLDTYKQKCTILFRMRLTVSINLVGIFIEYPVDESGTGEYNREMSWGISKKLRTKLQSLLGPSMNVTNSVLKTPTNIGMLVKIQKKNRETFTEEDREFLKTGFEYLNKVFHLDANTDDLRYYDFDFRYDGTTNDFLIS